jgi:hypothetical protein
MDIQKQVPVSSGAGDVSSFDERLARSLWKMTKCEAKLIAWRSRCGLTRRAK